MEQIEIKPKDANICFKVTKDFDEEIIALMKKKRWNKSAFIRVAIQKELDRIKKEEG